jgi:S-(hydroxymethyl)glutathione dehydrogenase/alcohol dehydrogenase
MRAAVLREVGQPLSIETITLADPGPHEALVTLQASGVCHSDYSIMHGSLPSPLPVVLGHEGAGVVTAIGPQTTRVRPGDHVILAWQSPCDNCPQCLAGQHELCAAPATADFASRVTIAGQPISVMTALGTFAEAIVTHENCLIPYSERYQPEVAALVGCAVMTGVGAVVNTAALRPGETAAVVGCGGVGLSAIQGARLAGASRIIAIDRVPEKLELARANGATDAVLSDGAVEQVFGITSGVGVDHGFDCVGISSTMRTAWDVVRTGGSCTLVGIGPIDLPLPFVLGDLMSSKTLKFSMYGGANARRDFTRLLALHDLGRLDLSALIGERIGLDGVNDAMDQLTDGRAARSVIVY